MVPISKVYRDQEEKKNEAKVSALIQEGQASCMKMAAGSQV